MKQAFIYWPAIAPQDEPKKEEEKEVKQETSIVEEVSTEEKNIPEAIIEEPFVDDDTRFDINLSGNIIDISKHQGTIDFKALKQYVGLVIARASCGSDKDIKIDEYAKEMIKNRIPFGVYCYSYAGTVEKAKDEAQKLVAYAEQYDPLFYVLDAEEERLTTETIKAFVKELRNLTSERIGCYVAHHRYKAYKYDTLRDLFDFTWIPCYGKNNGTLEGSKEPSYPCELWQYTSTGKIAGIKGNCDMNVIHGEKTLEWFLTNYDPNYIEDENEDENYPDIEVDESNISYEYSEDNVG
jgi:GH25 family lysozyme M1 (1,4-beta-N-acetylmuramidase)